MLSRLPIIDMTDSICEEKDVSITRPEFSNAVSLNKVRNRSTKRIKIPYPINFDPFSDNEGFNGKNKNTKRRMNCILEFSRK